MLLSEILVGVEYSCDNFADVEISDIVYDSRKAAPDTLFVALMGAFTDGHRFAESAYVKGTRVFLVEKRLDGLDDKAMQIKVDDTRATLAVISASFFRHPERELDVVGVTGTKGKTTVTQMLRKCLDACGVKSGVIGTMGAYYADKYIPTVNTTPESYELHRIMREMADNGCKAVFMEVSSLGLKSHRVDGIRFKLAVFTNLSPDHIGGAEHASFEEYSYWKAQLFKMCDVALLNADDEFSNELKGIAPEYMTFAIDSEADFIAEGISNLRADNFFGVSFACRTKADVFDIRCALPGFFSVYNALAAVAVCSFFGIKRELICDALSKIRVTGRMECIDTPADYDVIIDYAHNGQSFNAVIDTVSEYLPERIITVFGSVGDRAQLRRREMGVISGEKATLSVITTDDPGFEDPESIANEIASYVDKAGGKSVIIVDREKAVFYALENARCGDVVLILGKGHEVYQKIGNEKVHYSDHESVRKFFEEKK